MLQERLDVMKFHHEFMTQTKVHMTVFHAPVYIGSCEAIMNSFSLSALI